jgi:hypothetical protein
VPSWPAKITGVQTEYIYEKIPGKTRLQHPFQLAVWTLGLMRRLNGEPFGIRLSMTSAWRLIKQIGLSASGRWGGQSNRTGHRSGGGSRGSRRAFSPWRRSRGKHLIWRPGEGAVALSYRRRTSALPGATPVLRTSSVRRQWNMISALNGRGQMRFIPTKSVSARVRVKSLRLLTTGAPGAVSLIVDGHPNHQARCHHGSLVRRFLQEYG